MADKKTLTRAVHHIPISETNSAKLAVVDELWDVYKALCQQYAQHFCVNGYADGFADPFIETLLSARWQRVAIQQAAGMAQSWLSNRQNHYDEYQSKKAYYDSLPKEKQEKRKAPEWVEPELPTLRNVCIQANVNVIHPFTDDDQALGLEAAHKGHFDYWLKFSTLVKGKPIYLPVKLAKYHREALQDKTINKSVQINRDKHGKWWLNLTFSETQDKHALIRCACRSYRHRDF